MSTSDLLVIALVIVAAILAVIDLSRQKWQSLTTWAVLAVAVALLIPVFLDGGR